MKQPLPKTQPTAREARWVGLDRLDYSTIPKSKGNGESANPDTAASQADLVQVGKLTPCSRSLRLRRSLPRGKFSMAFQCFVVTPEQQVLDESIVQAIVPGDD